MSGIARDTILKSSARWAAVSALRRGPHSCRSKQVLWPLLKSKVEGPLESDLLRRRSVSQPDFDTWHKEVVEAICSGEGPFSASDVGWAAKLVNMYLKHRVYLPKIGPDGLSEALHPPFDGFLRQALRAKFGTDSLSGVPATIKAISSYVLYETVLQRLRAILASDPASNSLFELEQYWSANA